MKVLVACEYSGIVREAFNALGHDAMSCDLLETEQPGNHYQGDIRDVIGEDWDLLIAHPPCTDLAVSGNAHMAAKLADGRTQAGIDFVRYLMLQPHIPRIAVENPVSVIASRIRPSDQTIQPWEFGHGEVKSTCFWLKNLPLLRPTNIVSGRETRVWSMGPSDDRWKERSRTFPGIAAAMAEQWGSLENYAIQDELMDFTA
jgi:hypothetical protein